MRHVLPTALAASLALAGCVIPVGAGPGPASSAAPVVAPPPVLAPITTTGGASASGSLKAKQSTVDLEPGAEQLLNALVVDEAGLVPTSGVIWLSSNDRVATVNPTSGQVRAIAPGTAVVTAVLQANPAAKAQIEVRVGEKDLIKTITIEPGATKLEAGGRVTLTATVAMADGTINGNVKWASSDETVAKVNATTGEVTALRDGKVTIEGVYALDPRFKGIAVITIGEVAATPPPTDPGLIAPGGEPGELIASGPKGRWIAQVVEGATSVSGAWFRDEEHGWIQTDAGVYATEDAGDTWAKLAGSPQGVIGEGNNMGGVKWVDDDVALVPKYGTVERTTDGGATWTTVPFAMPQYKAGSYNYFASATLRHVAVADDDEVYAFIGTPGQYLHMLFRSEDQGATWTPETWDAFKGHELLDMVGVGGSRLLSTNQGVYRKDGEAWTKLHSAGVLAVPPGSKTVFYAGHDAVKRSDDGGATWVPVGTPGTGTAGWQQPTGLSFADDTHGLAYGYGGAFTTNDGGKTWTAGEIPELVRGSAFAGGARLSAERGYVVRGGTLYRFVLP